MRAAALAIAAVSLAQLAGGQPHHGRRHAHMHRRDEKDDVVKETVVEVVYAQPTEVPDVIVFVNQFGDPVSTMTDGMLEFAPTIWRESLSTIRPEHHTNTASPAPEVTHQLPVAAAPAAQSAPVVAPPAQAAPPPDEDSSASSPSPPPSQGGGFGFAYNPYKADSSCKTQSDVDADFGIIGSGYSLVRLYGTDCDQVATVISAAKAHGMKIFAGIFDINSLSTEVATIVAAANGDWSTFDTISVGNELVNSGVASADTVVAAIGTVRGLLKAAGYPGRVVTVDTLTATRSNPSLCDASDYCAVNCHPFFDPNTAASEAGTFLATQVPTLRAVLADQNQEIVVTETGWPSRGSANGLAVPSPANQVTAISAIKSHFSATPSAVILFSTFNDIWKVNSAATFNAEQFWGFLGNAPSG